MSDKIRPFCQSLPPLKLSREQIEKLHYDFVVEQQAIMALSKTRCIIIPIAPPQQ